MSQNPTAGSSDRRADATFASAFSDALSARGVTLTALRHRLEGHGNRVSLAALSYWRSGARVPDLDDRREVIGDIEDVLGLAPGALAELATRRRPPAPLPQPDVRYRKDWGIDFPALVAEAQGALDTAPSSTFRALSMQQICDVREDGTLERAAVHLLLRCTGERIERFRWSTAAPDGFAVLPSVSAIEGGTLQGIHVSAGNRMVSAAVAPDRPLAQGDTAMLVLTFEYPPGHSAGRLAIVGVSQPARKLGNWVRFSPSGVPDWFVEVEVSPNGQRAEFRGLDAPTSIHQTRWNFGPGSISLEWGSGEPPELSARRAS
ncbi:hypothetical protein [Microbacterium candidum]|uniref:XRE family transcriptional regulator n=1 Tax=Microbacterium candidum TaxID=3041922 RepID=A0ABT7MTL5_9MICO|nr:hypothetical protein [Microbacterium sp. ASV49]MDL9977778.1 hypothetical protein [Microbacterium sp. ASV49]